jgi:hypothetical protein
MLTNRRILIAEDEPFTAMDLAQAIAASHGLVLGPFFTVAAGLAAHRAAEAVHGAILDVRLSDGEVTPLAHELLDRGVKVIFHTASAIPREITDRHGELPLCAKPAQSDAVVAHLVHHLARP